MNILVVGAGGIGSELVNILIETHKCSITLIDPDTIELSNLNRQYFFNELDIDKYKSEVLSNSIKNINSTIPTEYYTEDIRNSKFTTEFFKVFDCVVSAVDNITARNHINIMAVLSNTTVIESGSAGYNGQVQIIRPKVTECYACREAGSESFTICTLRGRPTDWQHCVHWAQYDFIPRVKEAEGLQEKESVSESKDEDLQKIKSVSESVLEKEIKSVLADINLEGAGESESVIEIESENEIKSESVSESENESESEIQSVSEIESLSKSEIESVSVCQEKIKSVSENRLEELQKKESVTQEILEKITPESINIPETVDFIKKTLQANSSYSTLVHRIASIRATQFNIEIPEEKITEEILNKTVPSVITTNAIIAGLISIQLKLLSKNITDNIYYTTSRIPVQKVTGNRPNPLCAVCSCTPITLRIVNKYTLRLLITEIGIKIDKNTTVIKESSLLYDEEYTDLLDLTVKELNITTGAILTISTGDVKYLVYIIIDEIE